MKMLLLRPLLLAASLLLALPAHALRLDQLGHLHGLTFDPESSESLLVAAHDGLYRVASDGTAERLNSRTDDFMTLAAVPGDPATLYASGHPPTSGNLGLLRSTDGGKSWEHWSDGHDGPADFHALAIRPDHPATMFGVHQGLQVSQDAGKTWQPVAAAPERLIALAAASGTNGPLFAATQGGLLTSTDGGISWRPVTTRHQPVSLVHAMRDGTLYAFSLGQGLLVAKTGTSDFKPVNNSFGGHYPLRMAVADDAPGRLALLTHAGGLFTSRDGGRNWQRYGRPAVTTGTLEARGAELYTEYCQACHGPQGVGQAAGSPGAPAERNQLAPSLDGSMHAWHHSDGQLAETIREGGIARGGRMPPWKNLLSNADITALVTYMKSLWGERERACQGAKHMNCDWTPGG